MGTNTAPIILAFIFVTVRNMGKAFWLEASINRDSKRKWDLTPLHNAIRIAKYGRENLELQNIFLEWKKVLKFHQQHQTSFIALLTKNGFPLLLKIACSNGYFKTVFMIRLTLVQGWCKHKTKVHYFLMHPAFIHIQKALLPLLTIHCDISNRRWGK